MEVAMLSALHSPRPSRGVVAATACVVLLGATASAAQSAPNKAPECPPPFGTWTVEQGLVRYAGFYTEQEIRSGFAELDTNGNGIICFMRPADDRFFPLQLLIDDQP
jgi:hypothetical protein